MSQIQTYINDSDDGFVKPTNNIRSHYKTNTDITESDGEEYGMTRQDSDAFERSNHTKKRARSDSDKVMNLPFCASFSTVFASVINLQRKKVFEWRIGVSTIFLVTAFITVLIAAQGFTSIIYLNGA